MWGCCSEEEAKKKIYSVCTTTYTGFGALISEELSYKVKGKSFLGFWTEDLRVWVYELFFCYEICVFNRIRLVCCYGFLRV